MSFTKFKQAQCITDVNGNTENAGSRREKSPQKLAHQSFGIHHLITDAINTI